MSHQLLSPTDDVLEARARLFRAFGDETRLRIVSTLIDADGPVAVNRICDRTGIAQNLVSHHLGCLSNCGLVEVEQHGRERRYELARPETVRMIELADDCIREDVDGVLGCEVVAPHGRD